MYQHQNNKSQVYWLALTGILMSITLVLKLIFYFIPVINGYGLELQIIGYVYGLIIIKDNKWKWMFWGITPWFLLVIPPTIINFWNLLWEYILSLYIFVPFAFWNRFFKNKNDKKSLPLELFCFGTLMTILVFLKLFIHTLAGVWWWMPNNWYASFIFNLPIYGITLVVCLPVSIIVYRPIKKIILIK